MDDETGSTDVRIVLPGGSGYLGRAVRRVLDARGDETVVLSRAEDADRRPGTRHWDGTTIGAWAEALEGADVILHLAGTRVDVRPTAANIAMLTSSRVDSVRVVGEAVRRCEQPPTRWVQLSTAAIHGDGGDAIITDETPAPTTGWPQMTGVATAWEAAFTEAAATVVHRVLLRPSVAIGADDPATAMLARLARFGLGGRIGDGRQWLSWIALADLVRVIVDAIDGVHDERDGAPMLVSSPNPVTNDAFMAAIRDHVGRGVGLPSPAWMTRIGAAVLGADPALALTGRRVDPTYLRTTGFTWLHPTLPEALAAAAAGST